MLTKFNKAVKRPDVYVKDRIYYEYIETIDILLKVFFDLNLK